MKAFFFTFTQVLFTAFLLSPLIFAQVQFGIRDLSLPIETIDEPSLAKRAQHTYAYKWPSIDGDLHHMPPEKYFRTAYWTFNATFLHTLRTLAKKEPEKAKDLLYKASVHYNKILQRECWKGSNSSAKAHHRIDTLARVASYPDDDPKHNIDPVYNLVAVVRVTCFERLKGGNVNVPVKRHTKRLIKLLGWDKESALRRVSKMHKQFAPKDKATPENKTPTKNKKPTKNTTPPKTEATPKKV